MRMNIKIALVLLLTLLVSGVVLAKFVGRFYCGTCTDLQTPFASGETDVFIRTVVNQKVTSWVDSNGNPNTVLICNGTICANFQYVKLSAVFKYLGYYYSNWDGSTSGGGPVGGGPLEPPPGDGGIFPGCTTRTVKVCVSTGGGPDKCEYQTFLEC